MIEVRVSGLRADKIIEIVRELRQQGLIQGRDFDFKYTPAAWDDLRGLRHTVFFFHKEKYATLFALKYAQ